MDTRKGEQYNLKWNNYSINLVQVIIEQQIHQALVDVTISCEGQFIKAHKLILSACSGFFQQLFQIHDVHHPVVLLNGVKFNDLKQVIEFMYQGEIKVLDAELAGVLALGEQLQIKGLSSVRIKQPQNVNPEIHVPIDQINVHSNVNLCTFSNGETTNISPRSVGGNNQSPGPQNDRAAVTPQGSSPTQIDITKNSPGVRTYRPIKPVKETKTNTLDRPPKKRRMSISEARKSPSKLETSSQRILPSPVPELDKLNGLTSTSKTVVPHDNNKGKSSDVAPDISKVPRKPNAFMLFANEWRKKLAVEHPEESNKVLSVRLGNMWKSLTLETKELYYEAAMKIAEEHRQIYPSSPKESMIGNGKSKSLDPEHMKLVIAEDSDNEVEVKDEFIPYIDMTEEQSPESTTNEDVNK